MSWLERIRRWLGRDPGDVWLWGAGTTREERRRASGLTARPLRPEPPLVPAHRLSGHRLGYSRDPSVLVENSREAYRAFLGTLREHREEIDWRVAIEFDVQETADHALVVFHDSTLRRMIRIEPETDSAPSDVCRQNRETLAEVAGPSAGRHRVERLLRRAGPRNFDLETLRRLRLPHGGQIPTLTEVLDDTLDFLAAERGLELRLVAEVKRLISNHGRRDLFDELRQLKERADRLDASIDVSVFVFRSKLSRALRDETTCRELQSRSDPFIPITIRPTLKRYLPGKVSDRILEPAPQGGETTVRKPA